MLKAITVIAALLATTAIADATYLQRPQPMASPRVGPRLSPYLIPRRGGRREAAHMSLGVVGGSDCRSAIVSDERGERPRNVCGMTFVSVRG